MTTRLTKAEQAELLKWPKMGVGFIEADVPAKQVNVKDWPNLDLSQVDYEKEIQAGRYDNGIALRCGRTFSGKYLTGLDFDDWPTVESWFRTKEEVQEWAKEILIEWHEDWGSIHALILTDEPLENRKISINGGFLEIKCMGQLLFASPSTHTDGHKWQALGRARSPKLLSPRELDWFKIKIDRFCNPRESYVSNQDKERYQAYLEHPATVLGLKQGRHDATVFIALRYFWAYKNGWLELADTERFERVLEWHKTHCKPARDRKEIDLIWRWVVDKHTANRDNWFNRLRWEQDEKEKIRFRVSEQEKLLTEEIKRRSQNIPLLSVSEALRYLPPIAERKTELVKVQGMISSYKELHVLIRGWTGVCPFCRKVYHEDYDKPFFYAPDELSKMCTNVDSPEHPPEFKSIRPNETNIDGTFQDDQGNILKIEFDKEGKVKRARILLGMSYDFVDAVEVDLQDTDKHEEITTLKTMLFGDDTKDVRLGERVVTTGRIWIEPFSSNRDARLHKRLYAHSIEYKTRRDITISNMDRQAIERFVSRFKGKTLEKLTEMFAPDIIGNITAKKALLLSAASCGDDTESIKRYTRRIRINTFLIGETGLAKSPLLRRIVAVVPGSIYESMQNTSTKALTCIISKEGGDSPVIRLGPAPLAKRAILAANELGRGSTEDDLSQLLDVQEEGRFSVNKYGFRLSDIHSPTVIIGSANPKVERDSTDGGRFDINDMGIIRPVIDRFDLIVVLRTNRDKEYLKEYNRLKNKYENSRPPNYDAYLEKHLLYCRRIYPTISDEAKAILSDFYASTAQRSGSPRLRETLFRCIRMVARLKLKTEADADDAIEVCTFNNQLLQDRQEITNIPPNPRDYAFQEMLYKLEAHKEPITVDELIARACFSDDFLISYIGPNRKHRENKKLRNLVKLLLGHSQVRKVSLNPVTLQWIPSEQKHEPDCQCAQCAQCAPENSTLPPEKTAEITSGTDLVESNHVQPEPKKMEVSNGGEEKTGAQRAHRAHSAIEQSSSVGQERMCAYCDILNQYDSTKRFVKFVTLTAYERHLVTSHKGLTFDPEPADLKKFKRQLQIQKARQRYEEKHRGRHNRK